MRFRSIKGRITLWYTAVILLAFGIVFAGAFLYSEHYGEEVIRTELLDEVKDLQEDLLRYPEYFPSQNLTSYYDDGVMLSIFDTQHELLSGIVPDEFPDDIPFTDGSVERINNGEESWFLSDRKMTMPDGTEIWIRGVHSYSALMVMIQRTLMLMMVLFPVLTVFTAFVGYRMIRRSLRPIQDITGTANEITASSALSRRLPLPKTRDEFYELSVTFNQMIESLEHNFVREKQFSSDAAHELRTPLSVILSHCDYCLEEIELSDEVTGEIRIIRQKAQQMSELVSGLLLISRQERRLSQMELEEVDLQMLAETVREELEEKALAKNISIEIQDLRKNPVIRADMSMITRMFINLMENAISYGKEGGWLHITMIDQDDMVCLKFQDNGIGIPGESLDKIWDRFYQADQSHSQSAGFGLGLFLVRQIVECHGGSISAKSTPGRGSEFTVLLPASPA